MQTHTCYLFFYFLSMSLPPGVHPRAIFHTAVDGILRNRNWFHGKLISSCASTWNDRMTSMKLKEMYYIIHLYNFTLFSVSVKLYIVIFHINAFTASTASIFDYSVLFEYTLRCKGVFHCMTELCTANSAMPVILIIFDLLSPTESKTMCSASNHTLFDLRDKLEKTQQCWIHIVGLWEWVRKCIVCKDVTQICIRETYLCMTFSTFTLI